MDTYRDLIEETTRTRPGRRGKSVAKRVHACALLVLSGLLLAASPASAVGETAPQAPPATPAPPDYVFPDVGPQALVRDGRYFWFKPIFAFVLDYTWFDQDDASLAQVGTQDDQGEFRAARLGGTVRWQGDYKWELFATVDYQERRTREGALFQLFDLRLRFPIGKVDLDIGKMKEPISYEMGALSVLMPQQERILLPFFPTRSIGVKLSGPLAGDRMTWSVGAFNDYLDSDVGQGEEGNDYLGRLTALAWESPDKSSFVHLGLAYRHIGADDGVVRLSGRPESNVSDKYVDTGNLVADGAAVVAYELLLQRGPYSLLAERIDAKVDSPESGDPSFSGWYATGSWILTGESRRYVRSGAFAIGPVPQRRWGALELVARYSAVDLTDAAVDGGELDKWHVGLNWWTSTQWKVGLSWGDADLDKGGQAGNTKMVLLRLQWFWG